MSTPLQKEATALWLIKNTKLTFKQISDFCKLHILEIEKLADGDNPKIIQPLNPIDSGELLEETIKNSEEDENLDLIYNESESFINLQKHNTINNKYKSKYKKEHKPEAILWLIENYPSITDYEISKLLSTTTITIKSIKNKSHWNYKNLTPKNPINLELCTEENLRKIINKHQSANKDSTQQTHSID